MRLAIVDDNETNLLLLRGIAEKSFPELQVVTYQDPQEADLAFQQEPPDLLMVDYMMPVMDGVELTRRFRRRPATREVPVVVITAVGSDRAVKQLALEAGATDFLSKPVDPQEVAARLRNLLALRRSHLKLKDRNAWLADEVRKATETVIMREEELIFRLARAAEFRDPETGGHILRMAHYSLVIAGGLGIGADETELIFRAAPMHDIGKIGIPDGILLKPGRLDESEIDVMRTHPDIGFNILSGSQSQLIQMAAEIALSHHEKWDGSGYPKGITGEAIPLAGRIVAVADVFDALTTTRPYKAPWSLEKARAFLEDGRGTHFDPACVDAFLERWDEVLRIRDEFQDGPDDRAMEEALLR